MGCTVHQPSPLKVNRSVIDLKQLLLTLRPKVDVQEANDLAVESIRYSYALSQKYKSINNPWFQNFLVNMGVKERGLCYEWTEDLLKFLLSKHYKTLAFHPIGANIGRLNEHNALSVSPKGKDIEKSILLDAWRNSGILYFNVIDKDLKYKWSERSGLYRLLPPKGGRR